MSQVELLMVEVVCPAGKQHITDICLYSFARGLAPAVSQTSLNNKTVSSVGKVGEPITLKSWLLSDCNEICMVI